MNYFKIKLQSNKMAYALREYFPYTDKPFFKSLDDLLIDESLQISLAHLFVQLYKDELIFEFDSLSQHEYIIPIVHQSKKFTKINQIMCQKISEILTIKLVDDYFEEVSIPRVDIRDDYTKETYDIILRINQKYEGKPAIIFDCCCSTGIIFDYFNSLNMISNNCLLLSYGIRYNSNSLNNTHIIDVEEYEFDSTDFLIKQPGYIVRIYGLFGEKNVEVDFTNPFSISIGENGYGKTTAVKLALLALKFSDDKLTNCQITNHGNFLTYSCLLAKAYFEKIEIYYCDYYYKLDIISDDDYKSLRESSNRVYHKKFGKGTIIGDVNGYKKVDFDNKEFKTKPIDPNYLINLDCSDEIPPRIVHFHDLKGFRFHSQFVQYNHKINLDKIKDFLDFNEDILKMQVNDKIDSDRIVNLEYFDFNYEFLKRKGTLKTSLKNTIKYSDFIPNKEDIKKLFNDKEINCFLDSIDNNEYFDIIRKVLIEDRAIEVLYNELSIKYNLLIDFNKIDSVIRDSLKLIIETSYESISHDDFIYFDCTKKRSIIGRPPKDRIKLSYYDYGNDNYNFDNYIIQNIDHRQFPMEYDEFIEDYEKEYEEREIELSNYRIAEERVFDHTAWDYDDPDDYNPYDYDDDDIYDRMEVVDPYYESDGDDYDYDDYNHENIDPDELDELYYQKQLELNKNLVESSLHNMSMLKEVKYADVDKLFDYSDYILGKVDLEEDFFDNEKIYIDKILHNYFLCNNDDEKSINTNFYFILNGIIEIEKKDISNININVNHFEAENLYNLIFGDEYHILSLGIYDILGDDEYNILSSVVRRIRNDGLKTTKDYLLTLLIKVLVDSYVRDFITSKHMLLEKLINKYMINKKVFVYSSSLSVLDNKNNYIPIDKLSSGEKNLIIIFLNSLSQNNKMLVLDEPDISMSIEWQAKILVDLLKYTNNKYLIVSQSPLLIQKNNLSMFVNRMDFTDPIDCINYSEFLKIIEIIDGTFETMDSDEFDF